MGRSSSSHPTRRHQTSLLDPPLRLPRNLSQIYASEQRRALGAMNLRHHHHHHHHHQIFLISCQTATKYNNRMNNITMRQVHNYLSTVYCSLQHLRWSKCRVEKSKNRLSSEFGTRFQREVPLFLEIPEFPCIHRR